MFSNRTTAMPGTGDSDESISEKVRALTQLRWAAAFGQLATVVVSNEWLHLGFPYGPLLAVIGVECAISILCVLATRRGSAFRDEHVRGLLLFDVFALGVLLHFSGGAENPFSFLFLIHVVLAAILLGQWDAWGLTLISALMFAGLFILGSREHNHSLMVVHLPGMWVAFLIAAGLIVTFVGRILTVLTERQAELEEARSRAARAETVSKLGMLAGEAAHELATPLATIALVSEDIIEYGANLDPERLAEDARLLRSEVGKCRRIIEDMASDAGGSFGECISNLRLGDLVEDALSRVAFAERVDVSFESRSEDAVVRVAARGLARALACLIQNAIDATDRGRVAFEVGESGNLLRFVVTDFGAGIPPDLVDRIKDPFFTTKTGGKGLGLGLFFAETVVTDLGGSLEVGNRSDGPGVRAVATVPRSVAPALQ